MVTKNIRKINPHDSWIVDDNNQVTGFSLAGESVPTAGTGAFVTSNTDPVTGGTSLSAGSVSNVLSYPVVGPTTLPTLAVGSAGVLTGSYYYATTFFVSGGAETDTTNAMTTVVSPSAQQINITNIPVSADARVVGRKIYRTVNAAVDPNGELQRQFYLVATINDNTTTTYTDNIADGSLGAIIPSINVAGTNIYSRQLGGISTAIGNNTMGAGTGYACVAIGANALAANTSGVRNTAVGVFANYLNTTGNRNTGFGTHALYSNVVGSDSTAVGYGSLFSATANGVTVANDAFGSYAGYNITSGASNVAVGYEALMTCSTASNNTALGNRAARLTTGTGVVAVGMRAAELQTGNFNVAIGQQALGATGSGTGSVAIGYTAGLACTGANSVYIGFRAGEYDAAGSSFYLDNQNRTNVATGKTNSLMYGVFAAAPANQTLAINAATKILTSTVATLPSAATVGVGYKAMVTDATTPTFLSTVTGGGAVVCPVFSNGTNWIVG